MTPLLARWWMFNAVGLLGVAVQLAVLDAALALNLPYLMATAVAVEAAVLHNFAWHERWTWRERAQVPGRLARLAGFHAGNGAVSLAGNLAIMRVLVGAGRFHPLAANIAAIVICSLVNFLISDRLVYRAPAVPRP
jgi:putative flippase GtrA